MFNEDWQRAQERYRRENERQARGRAWRDGFIWGVVVCVTMFWIGVYVVGV